MKNATNVKLNNSNLGTPEQEAQLLEELFEHQNNLLSFAERVLGNEFESYQKKIFQSVQDNERTCVAACHDVGKTFTAARIIASFLCTHPNSIVVTTAPTFKQVKLLLWAEIHTAARQARTPLGGTLNLTEWKFSSNWYAIGITSRPESGGGLEGQQQNSGFQGFHESRVLVVFDEATGVPKPIWDMADGMMTSGFVRWLVIGNPTYALAEFARCFKSKAWSKIYLNCFDSPNLKANGILNIEQLRLEVDKYRLADDAGAKQLLKSYKIVKPKLLSVSWVVQKLAEWGFDHPLAVSKIFGRFPEASDNTLIPLGIVEAAQLRVHWPTEADRKIIGADIARFGADTTELTMLHGKKQLGRKAFYHQRLTTTCGEIIAASIDMGGADVIVVDETGVGSGVVDNLLEEVGKLLPANCEIRGVQFGENKVLSDKEKEKYVNIKAKMFDLLAQDLKPDDGLVLIPDSVYEDELPTILFRYDKKGRMYIESKDEYRKRTGRPSPDRADSMALANYGRHEALTIGKFSNEYVQDAQDDNNRPRTMAGSLNSQRNW